jgi:hypothetical protein
VKDFKVGDEVEFEVIFMDGKYWTPRWNFSHDSMIHHDDSRGPPRVVKSVVEKVYPEIKGIITRWSDSTKSDTKTWAWPRPGGKDCKYGSPGYLKHAETESLDKSVNHKCECTCPIQELWNFGCKCGATKKGEKQ